MPPVRDLESHLRALVGGLAPGEELAPGLRLRDASSERGPRLTFQSGDAEIHVEIARLVAGRRHAVATRHLALSYRVEGRVEGTATDTSGEAARALGVSVCRAVAGAALRHEDAVLADIEREAQQARDADPSPDARVREVHVQRLLERVGDDARGHYTATPYVGCLIGCKFCYAQRHVAETRALLGLPDARWGSYVDVRVNAPEVLARELDVLPPRPVKFCAIVSDPYHAVERRQGLTRRMLEVLRDAPRPRGVLVLTRSALIERDAELLARVPLSWAGVSLPTVDDAARAHFEPRAASVPERLRALARCRDAGVRTFAIVQPLLPGSLEDLADALAARVSSARIDVLHGVEAASDDFADPRWAAAADPAWQAARAQALAAALRVRGVAVWSGELPPELLAPAAPRARSPLPAESAKPP